MKRTLTILALIIAISVTFTSCVASGTFRNGCKTTQGMIGYGR